MNSIGQTAQASIPPAIHPADIGKRGFVFLLVAAMIDSCCWRGESEGRYVWSMGFIKYYGNPISSDANAAGEQKWVSN
jgi:hypothetical protein